LLYLNGQPGSGLSPALLGIAIDLAIGLLLGVLVIRGAHHWRRGPEVPGATASVPEEVPYPEQ
jgi:hypothetical protein